jgi:hypothetical protein
MVWLGRAGADPVLGVEMASTGEVGCLGDSKHEAFLKAMMSTNFRLPRKNILIMGGNRKDEFLPSARALAAMGYNLLATPGTAFHLAHNGVAVTRLSMPRQDDYLADPHTPDVLLALRNEKVDLFINFPRVGSRLACVTGVQSGQGCRRALTDFVVNRQPRWVKTLTLTSSARLPACVARRWTTTCPSLPTSRSRSSLWSRWQRRTASM